MPVIAVIKFLFLTAVLVWSNITGKVVGLISDHKIEAVYAVHIYVVILQLLQSWPSICAVVIIFVAATWWAGLYWRALMFNDH
jgi:hypothetical protein